jgi:predicted O-linked N-acetylglucosamine transferase (SPINDLY family)
MFFLPYSPNISNQEILESANEFYQKCLSNNSSRTQSFLNTKDPNKKLRIGFVSGDFRNHALVFWLKGFFEKLKSHNIDVYCYCNNLEDEITKLWKLETKKWRNILNLDDQTAFELIQNDEIDILVDLSGHTEHNRLGIFSYKPAPIQITWLGQSGPMGLPQIDYMISDSYMVKAEEEKFYTEKILRLPNIYAPYSNQVNIELNSAPCLKNKFITFGCLNNFVKINSKVITTWIRILQQIENSRLILKSHIFSDMDIKNRLIENFAKHDIAENRLRLEPFDLNRENYLKTYLDIDIALDPFPFGGGTTTHDLILMGIPLITLYGQRLSNRSSASILYHIGCSELICYSLDEYIKKTLELAQDYELVNHYRTVLRDKYLSSPLNDLETFAKNFSNTLKAIWQKYCLEGIIKQ